MEKNIRLSNHALFRATQRGALYQEIISCIHDNEWIPLPNNKHSAKKTFSYNDQSPVNGKHYKFKAIEALFADEPDEIVVVTVKVYYFN